jgi:putative ATP-dependent endonuclease of the OLD family
MKISKIKISNLFTFPYLSWFNWKKGLVFDAREKSNFNILIGPNWSGKTNFLYIINQIFREWLINQYSYDKTILENKEINKFNQVIKLEDKKLRNLSKHYAFLDKPSKVAVTLKLNQYDFENIWFICKYNSLLNNILSKYSSLDIKFQDFDLYDVIFDHEIYLEFFINTKNGTIRVANYNSLSNRMKFVLFYIQNMELIQICMNIYNDFDRKKDQRKLYALKNTFALLESERNILHDTYGKYRPFNIDSISERSDDIESHKSHKFASVTVWYDLFIIKLIKLAKDKLTNEWKDYSNIDIIQRAEAIKSSHFFHEVNYFIYKLLKLNLDIRIEENDSMNLVFVNGKLSVFYFDQLSSGEKSIIMILISLFGYDLSNGLFIIDEPELHLHPYLLKSVVDVLKEIGTKLNIQFFCATHSPVLIDEQSINNVYKFSFVEGNTIINYPWNSIRENESTLIHILKFEHVSKIFFINKIIMVEWETDEYFWKFFLDYLSKTSKFKWKIEDYEILNINGKWSYKKRSKFLKKFGISTYFIWDWDNVIENNIIDYQEMEEYIKLTKKQLDTDHIKKEKFYVRIIDTIKSSFPDKYEYIKDRIKNFYNHGVFILKRWDLEPYLWLKKKGLEETIRFCNKDFHLWLNNKNLQKYIREFEEIVSEIFLKK